MNTFSESPTPAVYGAGSRYGHLLDWGPARLLVAEDDFEMRRLIVQSLRADGYEVSDVADGRSLLDAVRSLGSSREMDPELIVTDVRMVGGSGLDAVELLRQRRQRTPVLVVTAFGDEDVHRRAHLLDAAILDKPFDPEDLCRTVFELLTGGSPHPEEDLFDAEETEGLLVSWGPVRPKA